MMKGCWGNPLRSLLAALLALGAAVSHGISKNTVKGNFKYLQWPLETPPEIKSQGNDNTEDKEVGCL